MDRISGPSRGKTSKNSLEPADVTKALNMMKAGESWLVNADELAAINRGTNLQGLICSAEEDASVGVHIPPSSERGSQPEEDEEEEVVSPRQLRDRGKVQYADDVPSDTEEEVEDENYARGGHEFDDEYPVSEGDENAADDEDLAAVEADVEEDEGETRVSRPRRGKKAGERHPCRCKATIPAGFISQFKKGFWPTEIAKSAIAKNWKRHAGDDAVDAYCYYHTQMIASAIGFKTKGHGHEELARLLGVYNDVVTNSAVGDLLQGDETYLMFYKTARPTRETDALGPYKYFPDAAPVFDMPVENQESMAKFLKIDLDEWRKTGSLNIGLFNWWKTMKYEGDMVEDESLDGMTIMQVAYQEFDMYDHHLREQDGKANYG